MAFIILCVWLYFVIAFILVRMFFPEIGAKRRTRKQIKGARVYDEFGYDQRGFTSLGYHRNGTRYDDEGYDRDGFDQKGNPRPTVEYDNEVARQIKLSTQKRKGILAAVLVPLAVVMIILPALNYFVGGGCFFGHTPIETTCESPIICTKCEKEIGDPPGHQWHKDSVTGDEICVNCRAKRTAAE